MCNIYIISNTFKTMTILTYVYKHRKRIDDKTILRLQTIISQEIERRQENDNKNKQKHS